MVEYFDNDRFVGKLMEAMNCLVSREPRKVTITGTVAVNEVFLWAKRTGHRVADEGHALALALRKARHLLIEAARKRTRRVRSLNAIFDATDRASTERALMVENPAILAADADDAHRAMVVLRGFERKSPRDAAIFILRSNGVASDTIANWFGVNIRTVQRICTNVPSVLMAEMAALEMRKDRRSARRAHA